MYTLEDLNEIWKSKEDGSLDCNRIHVEATRRQSRNDHHRGLEYVWYWSWDIVLNRVLCCCRSLSLTHQVRITRSIEVDDGEERLKWRIPDLGIMRQTLPVFQRGVWYYRPYCRLYAVGEIKPGPVDESRVNIQAALRESRNALLKQLWIFFNAYPDVPSVIGMFIAGPYWDFQVFIRDDIPPDLDADDDASWIPSSDDSQQLSESSSSGVHVFSTQTASEDEMRTSEGSSEGYVSRGEVSEDDGMQMSDSSSQETDPAAALSSSDPINLFSRRHDASEDDMESDNSMQVDEGEGEAYEEEEEGDDEGGAGGFIKLGTEESERAFERLIDELRNLQGDDFARIPF